MANITVPFYEASEPLSDSDIQEVVQPTAGGIRQEKKASLATFKTYYQGSFAQDISDIADGTTPITPDINGGTVDSITSLTVANDVDLGDVDVQAKSFTSDVPTGTAPLTVASTTKVVNLNADLLDDLTAGNADGNIPVSNGTLNTNLNADLLDGIDSTSFLRSDEADTMTGDLTITGDLTVNGTTTTVNTETVLISDNVIVLNSNEAGTPSQDGGIEIERGTSTNYQFIFNETDDAFEVGEIGSLQKVATREDAPTDNGVATWDDATTKMITSSGLTFDGTNLATTGQIQSTLATGISPLGVASTTVNTNLNADLLDGVHGSSFTRSDQADSISAVMTYTATPIVPSNPITSGNTGAIRGGDVHTYIASLTITPLPVGTIIMFDANTPTTIDGVTVTSGQAGAWLDNSTITGWYACVDGNQDKGCPNLVDRFAMGKVVAGAGAVAGANTHTLSSGELPKHTHVMSHGHGNNSASVNPSANHVHADYNGGMDNGSGGHEGSYSGGNNNPVSKRANSYGPTGTVSAWHVHSIAVTDFTGSTADGAFANTAFDKRPAHYSLIYIRKCV